MNRFIARLGVLIICIFFKNIISQAQIVIHFNPALHGQTLNGLFMAQLSNSGAVAYEGRMRVTVRDERNKVVILMQSGLFRIAPGTSILQTSHFSKNSIRFGNSYATGVLSQTGKFPEGEFEYCYEFSTISKPGTQEDKVFENCFSGIITPFINLQLQFPDNGDSICSDRPDFSWQPLIPSSPGTTYRLFMTEKKERQSPQDAISTNIPLINQNNIVGFNHFFPPQIPALKMGKTYVWQVTAYTAQTMLTRSEIWEFTVGCAIEKIDTLKDSYRELKPSLNGSFYTANQVLKFSITNPYAPTEMSYDLIDLSDQQIKFKDLPVIKLERGLNKVDIELLEVKGLIPGKMYQLNIKNIGNQQLYLRFIYKAD